MIRFVVLSFSLLLFAGRCEADPVVAGLSPLHGTVFINEFMASNRATAADEHGDYDDWVEIYNAGDKDIGMKVMYLTDDFGAPMKWPFPDTVLRAGGHLLIWADGEPTEGPLHATFKLSAAGERLGLYVTDGEHLYIVDTLTFGPQRTDTSYGRIPDGGESWRFLSRPTPGQENSSGLSPLHGTLLINEFLADNKTVNTDEHGDFDDWVEIHNAGTDPVSLLGLTLTDNLRAPAKWKFPDTSIAAGGFLLIWADNEEHEGPLHATFGLNAASGEQLGLFAVDSSYILIVDTLSFGPQKPDTSYGRTPDGGAEWRFLAPPTPRRPNQPRR